MVAMVTGAAAGAGAQARRVPEAAATAGRSHSGALEQ